MTDIRPSPEMLDAAAANRAAPLEERDLSAAIVMHRALYRGDLDWMMKLHVRDGESGLGPPFSPVFEAYLDGRLGQFPWMKARLALRENCQSTHAPKHTDREEWHGSLCDALLVIVVRQELPVAEAQRQLGLPHEGKTRRTLDNALLFLERRLEDRYWQDQREQDASQLRSPAEWMAAAHVHRSVPGLHSAECSNPVCRRAA